MPAGGLTVPAVLDRRADEFGDRVMMSIAGTPVTFAQMRDRSCAAANVLTGLGVDHGDTVALFTGTCPVWVYFWLGAARIGAVTAAVNAASKGEFLSHALRLSRAKVVITDRERHPRLDQVSDTVITLRSTLVQGDSLTERLQKASSEAPQRRPSSPDDVGALFFTSHRPAAADSIPSFDFSERAPLPLVRRSQRRCRRPIHPFEAPHLDLLRRGRGSEVLI